MRTATCLWLIDVSIACGVTGGRFAAAGGMRRARRRVHRGGRRGGSRRRRYRPAISVNSTGSPWLLARGHAPRRTVYVSPSQPVEIASERTAPTIGLGAFFFSLRYSAAEWRNSLRRLCKLILSLPPGRFANWIWSVYWVFYSMRFVASAERKDTLNFVKSRCKHGVFSHVRVSSLHFAN